MNGHPNIMISYSHSISKEVHEFRNKLLNNINI